ncbi:hypothetical protein ACJMK2_040705 [Sinanodonta woodiana]|uniref:G-protein coupled receptors family 1 profile domain-containing protein n=1 Tax=Sinanodonta woodiana TaxID=1069815 RepID=A0ABD3W1U9_SINWO
MKKNTSTLEESWDYCIDCLTYDSESYLSLVSISVQELLLSILFVLSTVANSILLYVASKSRTMSSSNTKIFVYSLSISHLISSLFVLPICISSTASLRWPYNHVLCEVEAFIGILVILTALYSLTAVSVDRYLTIAHPFEYPARVSTLGKIFVIIGVWVFCAVLALMPVFGWGEIAFQPQALPVCGLRWRSYISYSVVLLILGFLLPVTLNALCCYRILLIVREQTRKIDSRKESFTSNSDIYVNVSDIRTSKPRHKLNIFKLIFTAVGSFVICWVPYIVFQTWVAATVQDTRPDHEIPYIQEFAVSYLAAANCFLNPIGIIITNRDYKRKLKKLMCKRFGCFKEAINNSRSNSDSSVVRKTNQIQNIFRRLSHLYAHNINETHIKSTINNANSKRVDEDARSNKESSVLANIIEDIRIVDVNIKRCGSIMSMGVSLHGAVTT